VVGYPCYGTLPRARDSHVPAFYTDCGQVQRASQCCTMHADMHSFRIIIVVRTSHCNNKGQADHARCKYKLDLMVLTEVITGLHRRAYLNRHQFCLNRALNRHQFCMGVCSTADPSRVISSKVDRRGYTAWLSPLHTSSCGRHDARRIPRCCYRCISGVAGTAVERFEGVRRSFHSVCELRCLATMHACNALQVQAFLTYLLQHHMQH
jgi:hypothetical protein